MLVLKQSGHELGGWPGANPYGFSPDDKNFCIFATPAIKNAPNVFKQLASASPIGMPDGLEGPKGTVFSKLPADATPTVPSVDAAQSAVKSLMSKLSGLVGGGDKAAGAGDAAAAALPAMPDADGLKSVAMKMSSQSLAADTDASFGGGAPGTGAAPEADAAAPAAAAAVDASAAVPEVRTYAAEGREWACTPYQPSARDPAAVALAAGVETATREALSAKATSDAAASAPAAAAVAPAAAAAVPAAAAAAPAASAPPSRRRMLLEAVPSTADEAAAMESALKAQMAAASAGVAAVAADAGATASVPAAAAAAKDADAQAAASANAAAVAVEAAAAAAAAAAAPASAVPLAAAAVAAPLAAVDEAASATAASMLDASGMPATSFGSPTKPALDDSINPSGAKIIDPSAVLGGPAAAAVTGAPAAVAGAPSVSIPNLINPLTGENKFSNSEELTEAVAAQSTGKYGALLKRVESGAADTDSAAREAAMDLADRGAIKELDAITKDAGPDAGAAGVAALAARNSTFMARLQLRNATLAEALSGRNATLTKEFGTADKLVDSVRASLSNRDSSIRDLLKKPEARRPPLVTFDPATGTAKLNAPKSAIDALGNKFDQVVRGETGQPFFDCIGVKDAPSGKEFMQTAATDAEKLANHFVSFVKTNGANGQGVPIPKGFSVRNPFDAAAAPINVQFSEGAPKLPNGQAIDPTASPWQAWKSFVDSVPRPPKPAGPPSKRGSSGASTPTSQDILSKSSAGSSANFGGHDWKNEAEKAAEDAARAKAAADEAARQAVAASASALQLPVGADGAPALQGVAYDGYISDCSLIVGGLPRADGTFDKVDGFATTVKGGRFGVPSRLLADHPASVAYVIPAAKGTQLAAVSSPTDAPGHCFDRATLLPAFNPLATPLPATPEAVARGPAASPLSTLLVFGAASAGLDAQKLAAAFGLDASIDVPTYDALAAALAEADPKGPAMAAVRANAAISNVVTVGASLLSADSPSYANMAVMVDMALAEAAAAGGASASPAEKRARKEAAEVAPERVAGVGSRGRRLAQDDAAEDNSPAARRARRQAPPQPPALPSLTLPGLGGAAASPAGAVEVTSERNSAASAAGAAPSSSSTGEPLNLADAAVVSAVFARAQALAAAAGTPPAPVPADVATAAASAVANLNAEAAASQNPADAQKTTLVAQQQLVPALGRLAQGSVKPEAFAAATAPEGLKQSLQTANLPGVLDAAPKDGSKPASSGKLSKGGAVAIGVLVPLVVLTVAGVAAVALSRRRRGPVGAHATERLPTARA